MGFAPAVVRDMTFWEFDHAFTRWASANGNGEVKTDPTPDEIAGVEAMMASAPDVLTG